MKLLIMCLLLLFCAGILPSKAQTSHLDSLKKIVRKDVRSFKISGEDYKRFKKNRETANADYFKPDPANISNAELAKDSAYVAAYRFAAYDKTMDKKSTAHHVIKGVEIAAISAVAFLFIVMAVVSK